jgi:predicted peptidase
VVFLHGAGERGEDGLLPTAVGIGRAIRRHPERFPCLVAFPQCPRESDWTAAGELLDVVLAAVAQEYRVDPDRIHLTGLSLGGIGTWVHGARRAGTFASLMPICGRGREADGAALARVPIWAFHGGADPVLPPDGSRRMVAAVRGAGGEVRYTEYEGVGHNCWDRAYGDREAIAWLLGRRRR